MPRKKLLKYLEFKDQKNCFSLLPTYSEITKETDKFELKIFPIQIQNILNNGNQNFIELCSGYCEYTVDFAIKNPSINCFSIDIREDRLLTGQRKAKEKGLNNCYFISTAIGLNNIFEKFYNSFENIYLVHPDPEPNNKKKRLNQDKFISLYVKMMKQNGIFTLITDNTEFYNEFCINIQMQKGLDIIIETNNLESVQDVIKTRYNEKFITEVNTTKMISFRKI
jgi:tRNA (guanine-N7-)-methyltransferase